MKLKKKETKTKSKIEWQNNKYGAQDSFLARIKQKEGNNINASADNEDGKLFVDSIISNKKTIENDIKEYAAKDLYDNRGWFPDGVTRDEWKKDLSIDYIRGMNKEHGEIAISDGPEVVIGGHGYYVFYDLKNKKISEGSLEG